jgi:hypothetical protein
VLILPGRQAKFLYFRNETELPNDRHFSSKGLSEIFLARETGRPKSR